MVILAKALILATFWGSSSKLKIGAEQLSELPKFVSDKDSTFVPEINPHNTLHPEVRETAAGKRMLFCSATGKTFSNLSEHL